MAKAQTDIRTTSYDVWNARPNGYQGTVDDVLAQLRNEPDTRTHSPADTRPELLHYLGVKKSPSTGPSVELDTDVRYGADETARLGVNAPGFYGLAHARERGWI